MRYGDYDLCPHHGPRPRGTACIRCKEELHRQPPRKTNLFDRKLSEARRRGRSVLRELGVAVVVLACVACGGSAGPTDPTIYVLEDSGAELHWPALSVPVDCWTQDLTDEQSTQLRAAQAAWNAAIGFEVLRPCGEWTEGRLPLMALAHYTLRVAPHEIDGWHPAGATTWVVDIATGEIDSAAVWVDPLYQWDLRVWVHELGHVLGLDHDEDDQSVMFDKAREGPWRITEADATRLAEVYQ